jgi:AraC-like DNA-binding protein
MALQHEHLVEADRRLAPRLHGLSEAMTPSVATRPMRDALPRLPPLAEQMDALESALRSGRYGPVPVRSTCDGAGFAASASRREDRCESEAIRLGDGAWLITGNVRLERALAIWSRHRGGFAIDVAVRGGWQASHAKAPGHPVTVSSGYGSVSMLGQDAVDAWVPFVGIPNEYVGLLFRDELAMREFGMRPSDLTCLLGELAARQLSRARTYVIEPTADMLAAARAIRSTQFSGASRLLYMKAKAYEMLANLGGSRHVPNPGQEGHARPADDANVAALAVAAMGDCTTALDVRALARQFDITENRLVRAFKSTYGTTPFGYANRVRIERGRAMLLEGHESLIDIAFACGYEHHSSFTTAYRRTYGETPRETRLIARRGGARGSLARSTGQAFDTSPSADQLA